MSYVAFVDLGAVHDPSVVCVGHREDDRVVIDVLDTYQGSRAQPVILKDIEAAIVDLAGRFALSKVRIESWQGLAVTQSLQRLGLPVEVFTPTAKAHAEEWPCLAQALTTRRLVLSPHERLREELLGLVVEVTPQGARVVDRGSVHQDHAVAVRGVVASLVSAVVLDAVPEWVWEMNAAAPAGADAPSRAFYGPTSRVTTGASELSGLAWGGFGRNIDLGRDGFGGD